MSERVEVLEERLEKDMKWRQKNNGVRSALRMLGLRGTSKKKQQIQRHDRLSQGERMENHTKLPKERDTEEPL